MPNISPSRRRNLPVNKGMPASIKVGVLAILIIVFLAGMIFFSNSEDKEAQQLEILETNTIYDNIYINDVPVGGLTKAEAIRKLNAELSNEFHTTLLTLQADGINYEYFLSEFDVGYDIEAAVEAAFDYARSGEIEERIQMVESLEMFPYTIDAMYTYDNNKIESTIESLAEMIYVAPVNATMERVNGRFVTTNEVNGKALNLEDGIEKLTALVEAAERGTAVLTVDEIEAEFTAEIFNNATSLLGTHTSYFTAGDNGRNTNIRTAASKINNFVLYPGEVFSTNKEFGAMTYDNGYRMAPVIMGGQLQDDIGGGICQVSSSLYMALLYAELQIVERQNHSQKVAYMDYGFDATLAGDYIDLKFRNSTDHPIYIETVMSPTSVTVNLYGFESRNPTRRLEFYSTLEETVPAPEDTIIEDPDMPLDERQVTTTALNGRRYKVYKDVYENGRLIETVEVNTSYYRPRAAVVRVGTGSAAAVQPIEEDNGTATPVEPDISVTNDTAPQDDEQITDNQPDVNETQTAAATIADSYDFSGEEIPPTMDDE